MQKHRKQYKKRNKNIKKLNSSNQKVTKRNKQQWHNVQHRTYSYININQRQYAHFTKDLHLTSPPTTSLSRINRLRFVIQTVFVLFEVGTEFCIRNLHRFQSSVLAINTCLIFQWHPPPGGAQINTCIYSVPCHTQHNDASNSLGLLTFRRRNYFFNFSTPVYKMWII